MKLRIKKSNQLFVALLTAAPESSGITGAKSHLSVSRLVLFHAIPPNPARPYDLRGG